LSLYPDAEVLIWWGMPTYRARSGWVALGNQKHYVSLYNNGRRHIADFKAEYPAIEAGTGCINFRDKDPVPITALKKEIRHAMEDPR